jgi:hypothetical protein
MWKAKKLVLGAVGVGVVALLSMTRPGVAQSASAGAAPTAGAVNPDKPFVAEFYYKVKWGYADEFIALFRKNHYPVLKKEQELGRILQVSAVQPRFHTTEDGRWDYRVTIVFKNAAIANDDFDANDIIKQLYPDQVTYKKEEQRRFEILDAHWDLPIKDVDLAAK